MPKRRPAKKRSPAVTVLLAVLCLLLLAVSRYLDSTIEKLRRKILKIMIATAVSAVALSLLVCAVFWKLAV